jgi:hypothetical protein
MLLHAIVIGLGLLQTIPGQSTTIDSVDGNRLWAQCTDPHRLLICFGYITGIADVMEAGQLQGSGWRACFPANVTVEQLKDVVVEYLRALPQSRHINAAKLVGAALESGFPCR